MGTDAAAEQQRQFFHLAQHRLHDGRRLFVEVARQQDRAAFDNRNFAAAFEQALRKLKPEQPAADHDDPPDARVETGAEAFEIRIFPQRHDAVELHARHGRQKTVRAGRQQQLVIALRLPCIEFQLPDIRIEGGQRAPEFQPDAVLVVKRLRLDVELDLGNLLGRHAGKRRAAVGPHSLPAVQDDLRFGRKCSGRSGRLECGDAAADDRDFHEKPP